MTAISVSFALMLIPEAAIAQAAAIAALPTFSAQVARGKPEEMRNSLALLLRTVLSLALPAAFGLILLRNPLVSLIYERGEFNALSTQLVSWALLWYATGLVFHCIVEIVSRAFYALHDTRTPVAVGVAAMSLNIAFSFLFSWLFGRIGWQPHGGLALANSLATALESVALLYYMRKRIGGLHLKVIGSGMAKAALATGAMSGALLVWMWLMKTSANWLVAIAGVLVGALVYLAVMAAVKAPELQLVAGLLRRFKRSEK